MPIRPQTDEGRTGHQTALFTALFAAALCLVGLGSSKPASLTPTSA